MFKKKEEKKKKRVSKIAYPRPRSFPWNRRRNDFAASAAHAPLNFHARDRRNSRIPSCFLLIVEA